jgi:hypothetical protein
LEWSSYFYRTENKEETMAIYFFMMEGIPMVDNPEKEEFDGAFINCWVNSVDITSALTKASKYIKSEGWRVLQIEDQMITNRERYERDPELLESLECFDQAVSEGVSAIFYVWPERD